VVQDLPQMWIVRSSSCFRPEACSETCDDELAVYISPLTNVADAEVKEAKLKQQIKQKTMRKSEDVDFPEFYAAPNPSSSVACLFLFNENGNWIRCGILAQTFPKEHPLHELFYFLSTERMFVRSCFVRDLEIECGMDVSVFQFAAIKI
jgi:hypothetical protein